MRPYTSERLQEHQSKTDTHTITSALLKQLLELCFLTQMIRTSLLDLRTDLPHLASDVRMI